jgi:hypothetical protein
LFTFHWVDDGDVAFYGNHCEDGDRSDEGHLLDEMVQFAHHLKDAKSKIVNDFWIEYESNRQNKTNLL